MKEMLKKRPVKIVFLLLLIILIAIFLRQATKNSDNNLAMSGEAFKKHLLQNENTKVIDCADNTRCADVRIKNDDRLATNPNAPLNFRGYADPSVIKDPQSENLYMTYTYIASRGLLETHLAKSASGGDEWEYVTTLNTPGTYASGNNTYNTVNEVSEIVATTDGTWYSIWVQYAHDAGRDRPASTRFVLSSADSPEGLGKNNIISLGGNSMSRSFSPSVNLSDLRKSPNCPVWTEPALFVQDDDLFLFAECVHKEYSVFKAEAGAPADQLAWEFVGTFKNIASQINPQAESLTQADVAVGQDGTLLMVTTPMKRVDNKNIHLGCHVIEVKSLEPPIFNKNNGEYVLRSVILDGAAQEIGPGACSYDPATKSGIMFITRDFDLHNRDIVFTLNSTGLHP